jgi:hypothetical protein
MEHRKLRKRQRNSRRDWETQFPGNGARQSSHNYVAAWFPSIGSSVIRFSDLFITVARQVDEAANFFLQLIEKEAGIYDKRHLDYARRNKTDLAWERKSHDTKESGSRLSSFETM